MLETRNIKLFILTICAFFISLHIACAQDVQSNGNSNDSRIFLEYVSSPNVISYKEIYLKDFVLQDPFSDNGSWKNTPERLLKQFYSNAPDSVLSSMFAVMHFPENARQLYFSAPDKSGSWNIYQMEKLNDNLWSAPKFASENLVSAGNEVFPILSDDGKELYFASNGYSGLGGYDIFVSYLNEESGEWGLPQNLGIPYSSPSNEYIYSVNHNHTRANLVSDRFCNKGKLRMYILDIENLPVKKSVTEEEARDLLELKVKTNYGNGSKQQNAQSEEQMNYNKAVKDIRLIQDSIRTLNLQLEQSRDSYNILASSDPAGARAMEQNIHKLENRLVEIYAREQQASAELQKLELEFLSKGIFITEPEETNNDEEQISEDIEWRVCQYGRWPDLNFEDAVPEDETNFRITDQTPEILSSEDFPGGLVYQIQLFVVSRKLTVKYFKGMAPVYERKGSTGKYIYSVGLFKSYKDAMANINTVNKHGFPGSQLVAYNNRKSISIKNARALEAKENKNATYQVFISGYESLPQTVLQTIQSNTDKDISKSADGGKSVFIVGIFTKKAEADALAQAIEKVSDKTIEVKKLEK